MEYINLGEPITMIFITFSIGAFAGAFWMFHAMNKTEKKILKELDSKTKQLNQYLNKYVDDDYEAY